MAAAHAGSATADSFKTSETPGVLNEDSFVYAAASVFNIIAPYVDHADASRVFSEVSGVLRRAQEASAEATILLQASQKAQERERRLRALEADRNLSRLKELRGLLEARVEKEAADKAKRRSLRRRLAEEIERASELERCLAKNRFELLKLQQAITPYPSATAPTGWILRTAQEGQNDRRELSEFWNTTMEREVSAAKATGSKETKARVEATIIRRMRSLSAEVLQLRRKVRDFQVGNARPQETLPSRPLTRLDPSEGTRDPSKVLRYAEAGSKGRDGCKPSNYNDTPVAPVAPASLATAAMAVVLGNDTVGSRHGNVRLDRRRETFAGKSTPSLIRSNLTRLTAEGLPSGVMTRDEGQGLITRKRRAFFDGPSGDERGLPPPPPRYGSTLADRVSTKRSSDRVVRGEDGDDREPRAPGYEREAVLERVSRAPSDGAISGCKTPPISDVRRHSFSGVDRRRGLGALPLPNLPGRRTRVIVADSDDAEADSSIVFTAVGCTVADPGDTLAVEETPRSDINTPSCIAVGETAAYSGSSSGKGNEWHTFSLGGDSPALSLEELITSGEFYPGGVSRTPAAAAAATAPAASGRSANIGLRGHHQQSTGFDKDAGGGEETKTRLGQKMSSFSWDVKCSDYRASDSFAHPLAVQNTVRPVRGNDTPDISCTCGTIPNLRDTVRRHEWHPFSLEGDSPALPPKELITSGEFYPGSVSRTPAASATTAPAPAGRSDNIGLRGHDQQSTGFDEDAGGGEETKTRLGQKMSSFSWDVKCSDYRASDSFAHPLAVENTVRPVRGNDTPDIPCTCGTIPNLHDTVRRHTNSSQQATSSDGTLEGDRFSKNGPRNPRRSVSAPGRAFAPDGAASNTDYGVEQQESLDDFLRDLTAVTGGDVAGGGRSRGRLKREGDSFANKRVEAKGGADVVVAL